LFSDKHSRFPDIAFVKLAIAHYHIYPSAQVFVHAHSEGHTRSLAETAAEWAACRLDTRQKISFRMALQPRTKFTKRGKLLSIKISCMSHCCIEHRSCMAVTKY